MSKRTPEDAGEERVTAKSRPMMNLIARDSVKDPNVLASTASESPGETKSESQNVPLSSWNAQKILLQHGWEKVSNWECLFVSGEQGLFLSVYVDDLKLAGKKQLFNPLWKYI